LHFSSLSMFLWCSQRLLEERTTASRCRICSKTCLWSNWRRQAFLSKPFRNLFVRFEYRLFFWILFDDCSIIISTILF
jgi:hypothetical protein